MTRRPPPDPEAAVTAKVGKHRDACMQVVRRSLGEFGFAEVPHDIGEAINRAIWAGVNEGKHYAHLRNTVRHEPPDPDRAPEPDDAEQRARAWERAFESTGAHASDCKCHVCKTPARGARRDGRRD